MRSISRAVAAATLLAISAGAATAASRQGIDTASVAFAQVAALEGPAAALGTGMRQGILAAFEEANRAGGVHGRKLELESIDDGYEPATSAAHVRKLIGRDAHIGLIGPVGTPTTAVTQPIAREAGYPFIGPFTGAGFLRNPENSHVLNVRATYDAETEEWVRYLVDELRLKRIAILYQDHGFGRVGLNGVKAALERRGMELAATASYTRNTTAVKMPLLRLRDEDPDAVVMVGAYKPIAEFISTARDLGFRKPFVNISFVGSRALADELGEDGKGVIISQVVPFPWDESIPLVRAYQAAMAGLDAAAQPDFVSLEGYVVGRIAIEALEKAGRDLTRESYLRALSSLGRVELGGMTLAYGKDDNQGSDSVFLTRITADGGFEKIGVE